MDVAIIVPKTLEKCIVTQTMLALNIPAYQEVN